MTHPDWKSNYRLFYRTKNRAIRLLFFEGNQWQSHTIWLNPSNVNAFLESYRLQYSMLEFKIEGPGACAVHGKFSEGLEYWVDPPPDWDNELKMLIKKGK